MKIHRLAAVAALVGVQFYIPHAHAADVSNENVEALIKRINELEQKVKVLERNREVDQETATEKTKNLPTVTLGADGLIVRSANSNFVMDAHGYVQADGRFYFHDRELANDTFLLRRVRPIVEGTVFDKFDYRLMLDLGSGNVAGSTTGNNNVLDDAYVNARLWNQFQIQVGKYKSPVGLERLESTADLRFVETSFATQLTPNYDLGAEIHNSFFATPVGYALGIFNGATDAGSDDQDVTDEGKDVAGRLFAQPFLNTDIEPLRRLGFGVGGSYGRHEGALPSYKTPGQQTFFSYATGATADGPQYRIDPQAFYIWGPFRLLGEYVVSSQKVKSAAAGTPERRFNNTAWHVQASYFLTGEENSFNAGSLRRVTPLHNLKLGESGWGAFEVAARVEQLSLDQKAFPTFASATAARAATSWGLGLNWYLNSNVKLNVDFEQTWFRNGKSGASSVTASDENVVLSRVQFAF